jgi:hypothetical protein
MEVHNMGTEGEVTSPHGVPIGLGRASQCAPLAIDFAALEKVLNDPLTSAVERELFGVFSRPTPGRYGAKIQVFRRFYEKSFSIMRKERPELSPVQTVRWWPSRPSWGSERARCPVTCQGRLLDPSGAAPD